MIPKGGRNLMPIKNFGLRENTDKKAVNDKCIESLQV